VLVHPSKLCKEEIKIIDEMNDDDNNTFDSIMMLLGWCLAHAKHSVNVISTARVVRHQVF
jgi:hypothetical protein